MSCRRPGGRSAIACGDAKIGAVDMLVAPRLDFLREKAVSHIKKAGAYQRGSYVRWIKASPRPLTAHKR